MASTIKNPKSRAKLTSPNPPSRPTTSRSSKTNGPSKAISSRATARTKPAPPNASAGLASPFDIMAARIANRVAEMAENVTFSERTPQESVQQQAVPTPKDLPKRPRKLDLRLDSHQSSDNVKFSAPFLDSTLRKMLDLQTRMLKTSNKMANSNADDGLKKESFEQSAELSKIIALICAEKARQGA